MGLKTAIQMDPIAGIDINGDSTFALALEAQARGHALFYYEPHQLSMRDGRVYARMAQLSVKREKGAHFTLGEFARVISRRWTWC
jgi:glutathione synthase